MKNEQDIFGTLPEYNLVYVDTSALSGNGGCKASSFIENHKRKNRIILKFNEIVEKREGDISTTPSILEEIRSSIKYYEELIFCTSGKISGGKCRKYSVEEMNIIISLAEKSKEGFEKLCSTLEEKIKQHNVPEKFDRGEEYFVNNYNENRRSAREQGLSDPDKELVTAALRYGKGGIISADLYLLQTYAAGIKKFKLDGCFSHNPSYGRTDFLQIGL